MRILIVSTFFPPLNSIASLRPYSWAKYWTRNGHDVTILTTKKEVDPQTSLKLVNHGYKIIEVNYLESIQRFRSTYQQQAETNSSVSDNRFKKPFKILFSLFHWIRHRTGVLNACRLPDLTHAWVRPALKAVDQQAPWDLVVSSCGPYPVHLVAHGLKERGQAKRWIADFRDLWSDSLIYPGIFPLTLYEKSLEKRLMANADVLTTVSDPLRKTLADKYGGHRVFTIENGFDPDELSQIPKDPIFPQDGKIRIVHTGSIYLDKRNPRPLFEAIRTLANDPAYQHILDRLEVLFVGTSQANLQQMINQFEVNKWVKLTGFYSWGDALRMQRDASYLLFLPWTDLSVDGVLTGKLFEYLFSGTPILSVGAEELEASQKLILEAGAGEVFTKGTQDIIQFLRNALIPQSNPPKIALKPEIVKRYHREHLAHRLLKL